MRIRYLRFGQGARLEMPDPTGPVKPLELDLREFWKLPCPEEREARIARKAARGEVETITSDLLC
jgi:hypothetical protein